MANIGSLSRRISGFRTLARQSGILCGSNKFINISLFLLGLVTTSHSFSTDSSNTSWLVAEEQQPEWPGRRHRRANRGPSPRSADVGSWYHPAVSSMHRSSGGLLAAFRASPHKLPDLPGHPSRTAAPVPHSTCVPTGPPRSDAPRTSPEPGHGLVSAHRILRDPCPESRSECSSLLHAESCQSCRREP